MVIIYRLDVLLFLFGTSLLFHVQHVVPDLHIGFSRGKSGCLVFPSLSEFSIVYCDPSSKSLQTINSGEDVKSQTRLSDFTFTFHLHALEKDMATHSSVLAWRIPGTEEPGGLPSMGLHRVGHN